MRYTYLAYIGLAALTLAGSEAASSPSKSVDRWKDSLVTIEGTRRQYDLFQPWSRRVRTTTKSGIVIGPREVLTTAEDLNDRTLLRFQRDGRGLWYDAELVWIDYYANLAVVSTEKAEFWSGLKPVGFLSPVPIGKEGFQLLRWRNGNLEVRKMEFNQCVVEDAKTSQAQMIQFELSSETQGVGWGEAIILGNKVAGMASSQNGNTCRAIPASTIEHVLKARREGGYRGLGFFDFVWQQAENPDLLSHLKLEGKPRGVVVIEVPKQPVSSTVMKPRDVILKVDGFEIDSDGYYRDPDYGNLNMEGLATRHRWARDEIPIQVLRDGKTMEVRYKIPAVNYRTKILPEQLFDREPEYLIVGGLILQPLSIPLLRSWGDDWKRRAPFRLAYYRNDDPTEERSGMVILTGMLPDPVNVGYQDMRLLVLDELNGMKIGGLQDVAKALTMSKDGFHRMQFAKGDAIRRLVLDAKEAESSTPQILKRYGIPKDRVIHENSASLPPGAVPPPSAGGETASRGGRRSR